MLHFPEGQQVTVGSLGQQQVKDYVAHEEETLVCQ